MPFKKDLFAAPSGNLQTVTKLAGVPIFTSLELRRKYLVAMEKTGKTSPIMRKLRELTLNGTLVPVYSTDKILKSIAKQQPIQIRGFAGLVTSDKKIYIFVETDSNIFSFTSNDDLATVTLHELIHYFASFHLNDFYNTFKGDLQLFYKFYFERVFNCKEPRKLDEMIRFINFELETRAFQIPNSILKSYYDLMFECFRQGSSLDNEQFNRIASDIIVLIKILQKFMMSGSTQYFVKAVSAYRHIVTPLYIAYKYTTGADPLKAKTLCFQELWSTSEVIAIPAMVKTPNPNIYKAINKL